MNTITIEEMQNVDGGGNWLGALLIADGTTAACMFGGGLAAGPWGLAGCAAAGAIVGIASLM